MHTILYPVAALALLSLVVMALMLRERTLEMQARRIHPQKVASSTQMAGVLLNTRAGDNYRNLFEMPVLFYVLCVALLATQQASVLMHNLAWAYVLLRLLHSAIHIGYNKVLHRLAVFATSATVLSVMWVLFTLELAARG